MTDRIPITCEARLMGLSKTRRKDGDWVEVKFHIHPDDHPAALFILPLGTDCELSIKGVESDDDLPTADDVRGILKADEPVKLKGGRRAKMAGILCNDNEFQRWIYTYARSLGMVFPVDAKPIAENAAYLVRELCQVKSRAEIDHDEVAQVEFDSLVSDYRASQRGDTDDARLAQRAAGPS